MVSSLEIFENYIKNIKDKKIVKKLKDMSKEQIEANFASNLMFGTAGMRGTMELGTNHVNELTVCKLAQSVADYLNKNAQNPSVVVCFDTRLNSKKFSRLFAKVLDKNNIKTLLFKNFAPTPLCVYATTLYRATLGVMITASHNNKNYNGIKIYDSNGIQINENIQQEISANFEKTDEISSYNAVFNKKLGNNIEFLNKGIEKHFINSDSNQEKKDLKIVYTPLNGTGYFCVSNILKENGYKFFCPKTQKKASGYFKTCPYPNPEFIDAFEQSLKLAKQKDADIIVATDPDADRIGVMVKHDGDYVLLTGNEIGYIFADYKLNQIDDKNKFVVTSVVSSPLIDDICKIHDAKVYKTLTGFMSLGNKAKELCEKFGKDAMALVYEESCGYVVKNNYFDKDGIFATLEICNIVNILKQKHKTLVDYLYDIYKKTSYIYTIGDSVKFEGPTSKQDMQNKVNGIRKNPPKQICGKKIEKVIDYLTDNTGLNKQNFIEYQAKDITFIIRPSGTEPKLKIYLFQKGKDRKDAKDKAKIAIQEVKNLLKWIKI